MELKEELIKIAKSAQEAFRASLTISTELKNKVLVEMAQALEAHKSQILEANQKDLVQAQKNGLASAFIDRLTLNEKRISEMAQGLREVAKLEDPVGKVIDSKKRPNGLCINKVRVPIGVVAIIYESRPNVTSDCIGLCFKSGNSVILRGGSEALNSNLAIYTVLKTVLTDNKVCESMVNMVTTSDRKAIDELLKLDQYIDVVIPRGGEGLIRKVVESSTIAVIKHYKGVCHVYVDDDADLNMATEICFNAKVQRPGVCNAMECMLVHKDVAARFLPGMVKKFKESNIIVKGCEYTKKIVKEVIDVKEEDFYTEYCDLILNVKVVDSLEDAIKHVNNYGSHHSDSIITDSKKNADEFLQMVDSACVFVNASTRFTDGFEFGMGAEIGISTDKLHARGPMALEELTTYKYVILGNGQIRK